jgi:hypothetical protein
VTPSSRSRRACGSLTFVVLATAGLLSAQSAASGSSNLSSVVLSKSLPGLVAFPPGIRNGPITESNLSLVTGGSSSSAETQFEQLLASGNVSGYLRAWTHQPMNGDAVVIAAFQFQDPTQAASFIGGENGSIPQQSGVSPFAVPNVPGATGYLVHTSASGSPITEYIVLFGKGNTDIQLVGVTESGDMTAADVTALASQQWANVSTPTNWTPIIRLTALVGTLLLSVIIVLLARRRRYPAVITAPPVAAGGVGPWGAALISQGQRP